jgi:ubiquinone/menaquinone biosynthesis C-methylase UbiE
MKKLVCALAISVLSSVCAGQAPSPSPAGDVNKDYRTKEGRASVAKRLANPERDKTQRPEAIVAALQLRPGMTVADIGTGVGFMLPYLSKAVGASGKVIAEDIQPDFLEGAKAKIAENKLTNATTLLGMPEDPKLPAGAVDVALVLDVYHHIENPALVMQGVGRGLKKDGHLVIVEFHKDSSPQPGHIQRTIDDVTREVESGGFRLLSKTDRITDTQYLLTFAKK